MEATARVALCIALTNNPLGDDWQIIHRLTVILTKTWKADKKRRLTKLLNEREPFIIPCALKIISLDLREWKHLMYCISQNDVGRDNKGNPYNEEIHVKTEHWWLGEMEQTGFETLRICEDNKNLCAKNTRKAIQNKK